MAHSRRVYIQLSCQGQFTNAYTYTRSATIRLTRVYPRSVHNDYGYSWMWRMPADYLI